MSRKYKAAVMLVINSDDPRLSPTILERTTHDAEAIARLRDVVLRHLRREVARVVGVFPVEHARLLMMLHEGVGTELGQWSEDPRFGRDPFVMLADRQGID